MEILEFPGWRIQFDRAATVAAYGHTPDIGPNTCTCNTCQNWTATRTRLLPDEFQNLLERLGIPSDREVEVYHNGRLSSDVHLYCGWYHFVGIVLSGERECSPNLTFGAFAVYFHSKPALLPDAFANQPVVQLEVEAGVPWLSNVPEPK